jgi:hypothetical protein
MKGNSLMGPSHDIHYIHTRTCRTKQGSLDLPLWVGEKAKDATSKKDHHLNFVRDHEPGSYGEK